MDVRNGCKRVLVCGGRNFNDKWLLGTTLRGIAPTLIIHGGSSGADSLAGMWADHYGVESISFPADWRTHGRAAGPIRNQRMIDEGKPDIVVAFAGGRGTADMVGRARRAGIPVIEQLK